MVSIPTQIRECITFLTFFEREITKTWSFYKTWLTALLVWAHYL